MLNRLFSITDNFLTVNHNDVLHYVDIRKIN